MKSVLAHAALALFGLAFAYQTWTREAEEERPAGEVTLVQCDKDKLASVELETATHLTRGVPKRIGDKGESYFWITTQRKPDPEPAPAPEASVTADAAAADAAVADAATEPAQAAPAAPDAAAPQPEPAPEPEKPKEARPYDPDAAIEFLANEKFDELVGKLTPLRAARGIGEVKQDKAEQFGFHDVQVRLRVDCGGKQTELEVGGRTYGSNERYVRKKGETSAYLLEGSMVSDLQSAQYKFMQNQLHRFELKDVDEAVVRAGQSERKLLQRNRQVPQEARWVDANEPDRRNELFQTWFQRVGRLKAKVYLGPDAEPGADLKIDSSPPVPILTLEYALEGKPKGKLEVVRVDTEQGQFYYGRSEATRFWVALYDSLAKQVEDDIPEVTGQVPSSSESTAPAAPAAPAAPPHSPALAPDPHAGHPH